MGNKVVLYHGNCADGFTASWVFWKQFKENAEYIPVNYGQPPPNGLEGKELYIVDFSYKYDVMLDLIKKSLFTTILDHHKTSEQELRPLLLLREGTMSDELLNLAHKYYVKFDMERSGAKLAWEYFHATEIPPWQIAYVEDRDLWKWKLPDSKIINDGISLYKFDYEVWSNLDKETCRQQGETIRLYKQKIIDAAVENAVEVELDSYKVMTVNTTVLQSEIAGKLAEGRPFGTCFFIRNDGKKVWSLRSHDEGIDVSTIARNHGGGGHRNAASFME